MNTKRSSQSFPQGPFDPYLDWAIRNNFRHLRPGDWLPLLVRFTDTARTDPKQSALGWFTELGWLDATLKKSVRVPDLFLKPPQVIAKAKSFDFCVLYVAEKDADTVTRSAGWSQTILSMSLSPPVNLPGPKTPPPPASDSKPTNRKAKAGFVRRLIGKLRRLFGHLIERRPISRQTGSLSLFGIPTFRVMPPQSGATPPPGTAASVANPVAVAVLDEGIAFAHERFTSPSGSRIEYLWNQNTMTELTAAAIQAAVASHTSSGFVDEDAVYREIGGLDYQADGFKALARRRSHGTHVMAIAAEQLAGSDPGQRPIIGVELPEASVADPVGNYLYAYIVLGVIYALSRAETLANGQPLPLVCNISYGPHDGPHDGTHDFEVVVDLLIELSRQSITPLEVVLGAGNSRQTRTHAAFNLAPTTSRTLQWRLQPDDLLPSSLQIWVPTDAAAGITVTVKPPDGTSWTINAGNPSTGQTGPNGDVFWMWMLAPTNGSQRQEILIVAQPTATDPPQDSTLPVAPSGIWEVSITTETSAKIEAWIRRKTNPSGRRIRGRQAYFDDPDYERFLPDTHPRDDDPAPNRSYVSRRSTLSGIATGQHTLVVAGFRRLPGRPDRPADYSSMGPVSGGARTRLAPDRSATSDDSIALSGVLSAGTRSGSVVSMNGTSVAAPQVARWRAEGLSGTTPLPTLVSAPAGVPIEAVGYGCLLYPPNWYHVQRDDRPTL